MKERKFKFSYRELVKVKGNDKDIYEVVGLSYNYEFEDGESMEMITYDLKNTKNGSMNYAYHEEEIDKLEAKESKDASGKLPQPKKLSEKEVNTLLDMYNDFLSLNELYDSLNIENDYMTQANEVIDYLQESSVIE